MLFDISGIFLVDTARIRTGVKRANEEGSDTSTELLNGKDDAGRPLGSRRGGDERDES